jgi:hypothetical protein
MVFSSGLLFFRNQSEQSPQVTVTRMNVTVYTACMLVLTKKETFMTKTQKLILIPALTCFCAVALPPSSDADSVFGTWTGVESFSEVVSGIDGQIISESSGSNIPAVLSISFASFYPGSLQPQRIDMSVFGDSGFSISGQPSSGMPTLGPQIADGYVVPFQQGHGQEFVYYALTYQSILPDGSIDITGGSAEATMRYSYYDELYGNSGNGFVSFQSQSVPEPSSIVLAAIASLMIFIFARRQGFLSIPK